MANSTQIPQHVAIIMDGNRRWAKRHALAALQGHDYVSNKVIEPLAEQCINRGVKFLTLWAFSTENWSREQEEVQGLMNIFRDGLQRNAERLHKMGIKLQMIGDLSKFPDDIREGVERMVRETAENTKLTVTFALNYGGRDEILRAIHKAAAALSAEELQSLSDADFSRFLDTGASAMPDPDLIIRPGGELRLSGYLPWQSVYSELYFTDVLMPDFSPAELDKALEEYERRARRFGK